MLVLSRKKDEDIVINDTIIVRVIAIRGDRVRIGVGCPKEIPLRGKEVPEATQRQNDELWVIGRRMDESFVIGSDIIVTVIAIRGDRVRLGFEYPQEAAIHRREVYDAIKRYGAAEKDKQAAPNEPQSS
jgi:carbon storage regulator